MNGVKIYTKDTNIKHSNYGFLFGVEMCTSGYNSFPLVPSYSAYLYANRIWNIFLIIAFVLLLLFFSFKIKISSLIYCSLHVKNIDYSVNEIIENIKCVKSNYLLLKSTPNGRALGLFYS